MNIRGITQSIVHKGAGLSELTIKRGKYKGYNITIFKEYYKRNLEVKAVLVKNKGYRLCFINHGKVTRKIDRFA